MRKMVCLCAFDEGNGLFWSFHEENGLDEENLFLVILMRKTVYSWGFD